VPAENLNQGDGRLDCNIRMPMVEFPAKLLLTPDSPGHLAELRRHERGGDGRNLCRRGRLAHPTLAAFIHVASEISFGEGRKDGPAEE